MADNNEGNAFCWMHGAMGLCDLSCMYRTNTFQEQSYGSSQNFASDGFPILDQDFYSQPPSSFDASSTTRLEPVTNALSMGMNQGSDVDQGSQHKDDPHSSSYTHISDPGPIHGYQDDGEAHRSTEPRPQRVDMNNMFSQIDPSFIPFDARYNALEVQQLFGFHAQTFSGALPTLDPDLPRIRISPPPTCLPDGWPLMAYQSNPPSIDTNSIIRYVPALGRFVFICSEPECHERTFGRWQEFARHYNGAHSPSDAGNMFWCEVPGCERGRRPFPRKDKLNDHVRKVHTFVVGGVSSG